MKGPIEPPPTKVATGVFVAKVTHKVRVPFWDPSSIGRLIVTVSTIWLVVGLLWFT